MPIPDHPVLFIKPRTALSGPYPQKIVIPKIAQDGSSDYEGELTLIVSKTGKDISETDALDYVLGYTCGNDVSARTEQFRNSQWSFSKGTMLCMMSGRARTPTNPSLQAWTHRRQSVPS
jgi:2-keto-4-pentenoate hydratase/2-oxohepta-3-ene-1,7-dioic acid hydratase in catechol pathway